MKLQQRVQFYSQLATMCRAGVPLSQGLPRLADRLRFPLVRHLAEQIGDGRKIVDAFAECGFDDFELNLIEAGERSGKLEIVFKRLAEYWTRERELSISIRGNLTYPFLLFNLLLVVGTVLLCVIAKFNPVVAFLLIFGIAYGGLIGLAWLITASWRSAAGQAFWLMVPIIGGFWRATYGYRWASVLNMMFSSGIPLHEAVNNAWRSTGYQDGAEIGGVAERLLLEGEPLAGLMKEWMFPAEWADYVATAEFSGKLQETFIFIEDEARVVWERAEHSLSFWIPKLLYYLVLLLVAATVFIYLYSILNLVRSALDDIPLP